MGGASAAGYAIPHLQVSGMIPNGALQAGVQVTLNGIGNVTDGREFFDNWYWSAGMGFASGAVSGYGLAKEKGLNYWWGNEKAYNRTSWSFYNVDKPDYVVDFGISNVGSKSENDCVPTTFAEIETRRGGVRTYENFEQNLPTYNEQTGVGYKKNTGLFSTKDSYDKLVHNNFNNVQKLGSDHYLFDPGYMQNAANRGEIFSYQFKGHADNVRGIKVFINAPEKNMLLFRQNSYNYRLGQNKLPLLNIFRLF
jgi:hypothetical protein